MAEDYPEIELRFKLNKVKCSVNNVSIFLISDTGPDLISHSPNDTILS